MEIVREWGRAPAVYLLPPFCPLNPRASPDQSAQILAEASTSFTESRTSLGPMCLFLCVRNKITLSFQQLKNQGWFSLAEL